MKKLEPFRAVGRNVKLCRCKSKQFGSSSKVWSGFTMGPSSSSSTSNDWKQDLGRRVCVYLTMFVEPLVSKAKAWKPPRVHCRRMAEVNVANINNGMWISCGKKKGNSEILCTMNKPRGQYSKWNKPAAKEPTLWLHLYEVLGIVKLIQTGCKIWFVPRAWEEETESYCLMSPGFQIYNMKRFLEMDGGNGYSAIWMHLIPLNHTFRNH